MRYIIGVDLGTTNCCVAYADTQSDGIITPFRIPQLTSKGIVESLPILPSFCLLAENAEHIVGSYAQWAGAKTPTRLVQSAKSWLCHPAVNRRDKILPLNAVDKTLRISPVEATTLYLSKIKDAWNEKIAKGDPEAEFEAQEVILTVPASFDEAARTLTVEAARQAGFKTMTLLEEPQAAFYSWISQHESKWESLLFPGALILVCDVGGGTTDFSLIHALPKETGLSFQRIAVGDHLLLGGDNMDSAVAHLLEAKLNEVELSNAQWLQLCHEARSAKEALLSHSQEKYRVILQGTGTRVVEGSASTEVHQSEIEKLLLEGFFGQYPYHEAIALRKTAGLRTIGLPYEDDPSITKHLAHFLKQSADDLQKPDFILFNGGAMKPLIFQEALTNSLENWFQKRPQILQSISFDSAVARGAAYYGKVRRGMGVKIGGGSARSYYLVVDTKDRSGLISKKALTLLPKGFEEDTIYEPDQPFTLNTNAPVSFQLCNSHVRRNDQPGTLVEINAEEMQLLPPIHTILRWGKKQEETIPAKLKIAATPIGTLEISLHSQKTPHQWGLEFQLRTAGGQENHLASLESARKDETFEQSQLQRLDVFMTEFFQLEKNIKPLKLMEFLEELVEIPRKEWPASILRAIADSTLKLVAKRKISQAHEERWWNLVGFSLRPGVGCPLDDFRMRELWKVILSESKLLKSNEILIQQWICYRRLSAGFNKGQQRQLASELMPFLLNKKNGKIENKGKSEEYPFSENIRALASMELIDLNQKVKIGNFLVSRILQGKALPSDYWSLARLGARHLMYGSIADVISKEQCGEWVEALLKSPDPSNESLMFAVAQLARKTKHREINLSPSLMDKIIPHFNHFYPNFEKLLSQDKPLSVREQERILGDSLPSGLLITEND